MAKKQHRVHHRISNVKEDTLFFVINRQADIRKNVLNSGIDAIKSLEHYETFRKIKNKKKKKFLELGEKIKEINSKINHIVNVLPELTEIKTEKFTKIEPTSKLLSSGGGFKKGEKAIDLHKDLRDIQERLARMNF